MAAGDTSVKLANNALQLLGANTITSFTDGSKAAGVANNLYPFVKKHTLSMYPWKFALKKAQLSRDSTDPINEWDYRYTIPSDSVSFVPHAVFFSGEANAPKELDFEVYQAKVYTNSTTVYIDYVYDINEELMPSYFTSLLVYQLAWHLAEPITDQTSKADYWKGHALGTPSEQGRGGFFRTATQIDAQGQPPNVIEDYLLTNIR
jgi:hypothetical protein